jgi:hypothetical protein
MKRYFFDLIANRSDAYKWNKPTCLAVDCASINDALSEFERMNKTELGTLIHYDSISGKTMYENKLDGCDLVFKIKVTELA